MVKKWFKNMIKKLDSSTNIKGYKDFESSVTNSIKKDFKDKGKYLKNTFKL